MKILKFITTLALCSSYAFAAGIHVSGPKGAKEVAKKLIEAGIDSKSLSKESEKDSILVVLPESIDYEVKKAAEHRYPQGWVIVLDEKGQNTDQSLRKKFHDGLPESRVSVASDIKSTVARIQEIQKEKKRLKAGIGGLGTIDAPENDKMPLAPLGSSVMTSSGLLNKTGIKVIIHTASGSMTKRGPGLEPSVQSVKDSLVNAIALARDNGHKKVALPILAGSIFRTRMNDGKGIGLDELIDHITDTLVAESAGMKIVFTVRADNPQEGPFIRQSLAKLNESDRARFEIADSVQWAIVKHRSHKASAIINSANMEVLFGGGVSGVIASAADGVLPGDTDEAPEETIGTISEEETYPSQKIDEEAHDKILLFKKI